MQHKAISIRPFIGAKNFEQSRSFYKDLGFEETPLSPAMSVFNTGELAFYLQNAYIKDWVDNTMVFLEVDDVENFWTELTALNLLDKFETVKLVPIRHLDWGSECFIHDPSGILWHIGQFNK